MKQHILSLNLNDLKKTLLTICEKPYKVKQIMQWIFSHNELNFHKMTNVSKDLANKLSGKFDTSLPEIADTKVSNDKSVKLLLKLNTSNTLSRGCEDLNEHYIEMICMPDKKKNTVCISSQVGCKRNCSICATASLGLKRNLSQDELLSQVIIANQYFRNSKMTNLVLMGMGEPLDNFENIISFFDVLHHEEGFNFSKRKTTLSTSGIIPMIYQLADRYNGIKLAVSLNSCKDDKRSKLMPVNIEYPLLELKKALLYYRKKTKFRITFQYVMIDDFNMGNDDIKALLKYCGDISCKINVIKWNQVKGMSWMSPSEKQIEQFIKKLEPLPFAVTYRKSRGTDIKGACGQFAGEI
jgi:23S rRNA (adenine2503-C2)-methyltransferase